MGVRYWRAAGIAAIEKNLSHFPARVLEHMAMQTRDEDATPTYYAGTHRLAAEVGANPKLIERTISQLNKLGLITKTAGGYRGHAAEYALSLTTEDPPNGGENTPTERPHHMVQKTLLFGPKDPSNRGAQEHIEHKEQPLRTSAGRHEHEPNAVSKLTTMHRERRMPPSVTVDELLRNAYRLGNGDPWQGALVIDQHTQAAVGADVKDPAALLRWKLKKAAPAA